MARVPGREPIYEAAQLWKDECLIGDGALLPAGPRWTVGYLDQLDRYFVHNLDPSKRSFLDKLRDQLGPADGEAKRLMAELLWVLALFPNSASMSRDSKLDRVAEVWSWGGTALPRGDSMLGAPLEGGIGHPGMAFSRQPWREAVFVIAFARAVKALPVDQRRQTLGDPWRMSEWLSSLPDSQRRQMRHVLLHLLQPDAFEPIASGRNRRTILRAFGPEIADAEPVTAPSHDPQTAVDQQLLTLRGVLEAQHSGAEVNLYRSPWVDRWRSATPGDTEPDTDEPDDAPEVESKAPAAVREVPPPRRAWVIGAGEGATRWAAFREGGYVAIGWDDLGDFTRYADRPAVQRAIKDAYQPQGEPTNDALACFQFCREMAVGDEVFVKQGRDRILGYGVVAGDYTHDASRPDYRNVRRVAWRSEGDWTVPEELRFPTKTLTEVTSFRALLAHLRPLVQRPHPPLPPREAPYTTDDALAEGVFLDRAEFERILAALRRRKNVILQGAPGVGKSFVARRLAYALIGHRRRDAVQGVQFHQSYAYEDFVQGWRPTEGGGFALRNGVFYEFCRRAQARPGEPHVFVVDEINRGNLSKILGELMLLLEADKRGPEFAIPLTYSGSGDDTFHVPDNLFVVGLMNTADRSLAMVDYALRRRFAFITLEPRFASPAFRSTLRARGVDDATVDMVVERVGAVNAEITDDAKNLGRGFEVGHSYFVPTEDVSDPAGWYRRVVEDEVRPLLEEYWFDDAPRVARCAALLLPPP